MNNTPAAKGATYKSLFHKFRDDSIISRCRQYGRWTLPYLMADLFEVSSSGRVVVERDYQEMGALLVNSLATKLVRILFPTQAPFFEATASDRFKKAANNKGISDTDLRTGFARLEMNANKRLFVNAGYASLILALKHLIVTGNVLMYRDSDESCITTYGIQSFATRRDGAGRLLDCVLREYTTVEALPDEFQAALRLGNPSKYGRAEQTVEKYTRIHRVSRNGKRGYEVSQEVDTLKVGDSTWWPEALCPWMAPTWVLIPGEHYGRGMVEDYAGGFAKLSGLSEASTLYSVEIMRVIHLVGAGAGNDIDSIAQAESGEYVRGDPEAVKAHESGDAGKLQAVLADIEVTTARLARAFMYTAQARNAERVTMYELQQQAQEAEYTLGGAYSTLSGAMQIPLAHILMTEASDLALEGLITGDLYPDVTAGIPALGRSSDVQNLLMASQELAGVIPVTQLDKRINPQLVVDLVLAGRSIDPKTIFFTQEQQQANDEATAAAQQAQASLNAAGTLADQSESIQQTLGAQ
jgi:hypothetical protein